MSRVLAVGGNELKPGAGEATSFSAPVDHASEAASAAYVQAGFGEVALAAHTEYVSDEGSAKLKASEPVGREHKARASRDDENDAYSLIGLFAALFPMREGDGGSAASEYVAARRVWSSTEGLAIGSLWSVGSGDVEGAAHAALAAGERSVGDVRRLERSERSERAGVFLDALGGSLIGAREGGAAGGGESAGGSSSAAGGASGGSSSGAAGGGAAGGITAQAAIETDTGVGLSAVPEPSSYMLMATGLVGMLAYTRRRRSAQ